jgi:hypothetical protein
MATSRSCLHRRTTSAGQARRGCLPSDEDGPGPGPALLRRERGAGGSGAWAPKTSKGSSTKASRRSKPTKKLLRRHRRGRRSSSGRAWSEGHRRRGCRPRTGTTKTIRRRLRPPKVPLPLMMTMVHRSLKPRCLRDPGVSAWRKASDRRTSRVVDPLRPTTFGLSP